jgi:fibro-slime domain-containing protein
LGSYSDTISRVVTIDANGKRVNGLIGPYLKCAGNIETFYDAAYYLLNNLFVDNSYNQLEDDYRYLVMSKATVIGGARDGSNKDAYVFDAGFTYSDGSMGTIYDEVKKTISQASAESKWQIYWSNYSATTLHPFLPINDEGEGRSSEFRANGTPYVREDGAANVSNVGDTYAGRNYNYVMAANGEFVYRADDDLFFQFQGDDDVYMFVNGELVLDIGGAHSITDVSFYMNDYVEASSKVLGSLTGYIPEMSDGEFAQVLENNGITSSYTFGGKTKMACR